MAISTACLVVNKTFEIQVEKNLLGEKKADKDPALLYHINKYMDIYI